MAVARAVGENLLTWHKQVPPQMEAKFPSRRQMQKKLSPSTPTDAGSAAVGRRRTPCTSSAVGQPLYRQIPVPQSVDGSTVPTNPVPQSVDGSTVPTNTRFRSRYDAGLKNWTNTQVPQSVDDGSVYRQILQFRSR